MEPSAVADRPRSWFVCVSLTSGGNTYRINVRQCCVAAACNAELYIITVLRLSSHESVRLLFAHNSLVWAKVTSWSDWLCAIQPAFLFTTGTETFIFAIEFRLMKFDLSFAYAGMDNYSVLPTTFKCKISNIVCLKRLTGYGMPQVDTYIEESPGYSTRSAMLRFWFPFACCEFSLMVL
jgi:hypothetical protein